MKIEGIEINFVGGIEHLGIVFDDHMNIICGPNGIGKTTVLESVAHCFTLGPTTILKRNVNAERSEIKVRFKVNGKHESSSLTFSGYEPASSENIQGRHDLVPFLLSLKSTRTFGYQQLNAVVRDPEKNSNALWNEARAGFPLSDIKNWFVNRYLYSAHDQALTKEQLANFELAKRCFSALEQKYSFSRVLASTNEIIVSTPSGNIYYEYLSSGFKSCLTMLLGIIKEIEFRSPLTQTVETFPGVVLIDEIEMHLHPEWQAKIAHVLTEVFPQIQFLVTTHSPHVIQSAEPNQIVALEMVDGKVALRPLPATKYGFKGWTLDEVLTDVMGMSDTRNKQVLCQLDKFHAAIDRNDRPAARLAYDELDASLHPASHTRKLLRLEMASIDEPSDDKA